MPGRTDLLPQHGLAVLWQLCTGANAVRYCLQDIGPRYAGVLLGMSNTAGVLAGVFGTAATGYILKTGSWDEVWGVAVALYLVGTVVWNLFSTGERVLD